MVERVEQHAVASDAHVLLGAVDARDPGRLAREELGREVAKGRDDARTDQLDLAEEVALAGLDLIRAWSRLPGGRHLSTLAM